MRILIDEHVDASARLRIVCTLVPSPLFASLVTRATYLLKHDRCRYLYVASALVATYEHAAFYIFRNSFLGRLKVACSITR